MSILHPIIFLPLWMQAVVLFLFAYFLTSLVDSRALSCFMAVALATSYFLLVTLIPVTGSW